MATRDEAPQCGFALVLYQLMVVEKRVAVADAAAALGLSYAAMHSRLSGRTRFRPDEVRRLAAVIDDPRMLCYFVDPSPFILVPRGEGDDPSTSIRLAVAKALRETIDVMQVVVGSLEAGTTLNHRDRAAILREVSDAERAIAAVRVAVERQAG